MSSNGSSHQANVHSVPVIAGSRTHRAARAMTQEPQSAATVRDQSGRSTSAVTTATTSTTTTSHSATRSEPAELPVMHEGPPRAISPGTYITTKPDGFLPGLTLTILAGWSATEADSGEIALHPADRPERRDSPVEGRGRGRHEQPIGQGRPASQGRRLDGRCTREVANEYRFASRQTEDRDGRGWVKGTQLTLTTSNRANFVGYCPVNPTVPRSSQTRGHWDNNFYAIGGDEVSRTSLRRCISRTATIRSLSRSMRSVPAILQRSSARHSRSSIASGCPRPTSRTDPHPKQL